MTWGILCNREDLNQMPGLQDSTDQTVENSELQQKSLLVK